MRKDGKLKKFFMYQLYECAAVEEFLCEMALKGWMVEFINGPNSEMITITGADGSVSYTTTISHDQVPITVEDFGIKGEGYRDSSADIREIFLAQSYNYTDEYFVDIDDSHTGIHYSILTSPYQWIIDKCVKSDLNYYYNISLEQVNSEKWNANEVYTQILENNRRRVIVVYDNKIFNFEWFLFLK